MIDDDSVHTLHQLEYISVVCPRDSLIEYTQIPHRQSYKDETQATYVTQRSEARQNCIVSVSLETR